MRGITMLACLLMPVLGCGSPTGPGTPPPGGFRITPRAVWAGGMVRVTSESFRETVGDVTLRLGPDTYPMTRADDTTYTMTIPTTAGGVYDPVLGSTDSLTLLDQLTVAGFLDRRDYGPRLIHAFAPHAVGQHAGVIGGSLDRALIVIDLEAFAVATTLGGRLDFTLQQGPGMTADPDVALLRPVAGSVESWNLTGIPARVAVHPELDAARGVVARFGAESWLVSFADRIERWHRTGSTGPFTVLTTPATGTRAVGIAPDGSRAAVLVDQIGATEPGVPVFRMPDGEVAFTLPLRSVQGAAWSADSRTLAAVGGPAPGAPSGTVVLVDVASGTVGGLVTTDRPVFAVALDPIRSLVYVGVAALSDHPTVLVYDRATLMLLGEMTSHGSQPTCGVPGCRGSIIVPAQGSLFVVTASLNTPTRAYRFLLPATPTGSGRAPIRE